MNICCSATDNPFQHPARLGIKEKVDCYLSNISMFPDVASVPHFDLVKCHYSIKARDTRFRNIKHWRQPNGLNSK